MAWWMIVLTVPAFYLIARPAYFRMKFEELNQEYLARWRLLSVGEQTKVLYATYGLRIREEYDKLESIKRKPGRFPDLDMDCHFENIQSYSEKCPNFSAMSELELFKAFLKVLESHWTAMRAVGDYDFPGTRVELDHIFGEREVLSQIATNHLPAKSAITTL